MSHTLEPSAADLPLSRRDRQRAATVSEVKQAALVVIARDGAGALTFSAVGREIGIAPSALYRYFDDRDQLLSVLIAEGHEGLGQHIRDEVQSGADPADALRRGLRGFRLWAKQNATQFALIYGPPVNGHETYDENTIPASLIISDVLFTALQQVYSEAKFEVAPSLLHQAAASTLPHGRLPETGTPEYRSSAMIISGYLAWFQIYGFVAFEVFGHFPPQFQTAEVADAMFESMITSVVAGLTD